MATNPKIGFTSMEEELTNVNLPIQGKIPEWIAGVFIKDGFSKWEVGKERYRHWFDGLAMLHSFNFDAGKVYYTNRFLRSEAYKQAIASQQIAFSEFATEPTGSYFGRVFLRMAQRFTDNAAVNVVKISDSFVALTETPERVEFNPLTLETLGRFKYENDIHAQLTTAHPHVDINTMEIINYYTRFSLKNHYDIYTIKNRSKKRELITTLTVDEPAYMHTFALTENYVILAEFPLYFNPLNLLFSGKPIIDCMTWMPDKGIRFLVVDRNAKKLVKMFQSDVCFCYHHINAFERDGNIIMDFSAYEDTRLVETGYLERLRAGELKMPRPEIRRYSLPMHRGKESVDYEVLTDAFVEFPRIHYNKHNMYDYSIIYGMSSEREDHFLSDLKKINIKTGKVDMWIEDGCFPGEPVFVPEYPGASEDEGVVLSVVLNTNKNNSFLLVLDASNFQELGRAVVPHYIPFGAHGQYYSDINAAHPL